MQPLRPEEREQILKSAPAAAPEDLDEYEGLLAALFATDPAIAGDRSLESGRAPLSRDPALSRLEELHQKLFRSPMKNSQSDG